MILKRLSLVVVGLGFFAQADFAHATQAGEVALIQYDADRHFGDLTTNRRNLTQLAHQAVAHGANLIVFPEGSLFGYASTDRSEKWCKQISSGCRDVHTVAEAVPAGDSTQYWSAFAHQNQVYLLFNLPENAEGDVFYNTSVVVGPNGYLAKYRKRVLYQTDTFYASPGADDLVFETPYGKFGILICLDVTSPGYLEAYADKKVDAAIVMMDWDDDPNGQFAARTFMRQRATAANLPIYASDMSPWDGTGKYDPSKPRERNGLKAVDIGRDGISYHRVRF